jgi:hypothetical protein
MMNAMAIFANKRKTKAVIDMAFIGGEEIHKLSWEVYRNTKLNSPDKLKELPFIGEITKFHLARNCGQLQFVKPDVHLEKAAKFWHFQSPMEMCETIKEKFDMPVGLIDLVLWYSFSTFGSNY